MATTNKNLNTPANGADVDDWDVPVNANWNAIDSAFGGVTFLNVTSVTSTPVVLTLTQYTPPIVEIAGTLTANVTYQLPSGVGGFWSIFNNSTGAFTITFASLGGGTSLVLTQGYTTATICDGTNVGYFNTLNIGSYAEMHSYNTLSTHNTVIGPMAGYGSAWKLTPSASGKVRITIQGVAATTAAGDNVGVSLRYGTGSAPSAGASATGTNPGVAISPSCAGSASSFPTSMSAELTLTPGTAYWFDIVLTTNGSETFFSQPNVDAIEHL